tara:strand:- start:305 stop:1117 length:813 start_codon:yes stop_codon:yes gene_type:complete
MNKKEILDAKIRCKNHRKKILDISQKVSALHVGGGFSSIEIIDFIHYQMLNKKDKFILSKGHGAIALYVVLNSLGIIDDDEISKYCTSEGKLGCHPDMGNPGINASTGSLGHGLGMCVGVGHAYKIQNLKKNVVTMLSDGELQEGSTWEYLMMAANLKLDNLYIFIDHNGSQSYGITKYSHPAFYPMIEKLKSFNCEVEEVDGHDYRELLNARNVIEKKTGKPKIIFCNTVKGKPISYMENKPIWHYRSPNKDEYEIAISDLEKSFLNEK